MTMKTVCCLKKFEFQRYPPYELCTASYDHKSFTKKVPKLKKTNKKTISVGRCWAKIGLRKLSQMLIRSGEIPSPRQISIDKTNDYVMNSERGAR